MKTITESHFFVGLEMADLTKKAALAIASWPFG